MVIKALVRNDTFLAIDTAPLKALPQWSYFNCLPTIILSTMALSTRIGPSVQLIEPITPTKAVKQMHDRPI